MQNNTIVKIDSAHQSKILFSLIKRMGLPLYSSSYDEERFFRSGSCLWHDNKFYATGFDRISYKAISFDEFMVQVASMVPPIELIISGVDGGLTHTITIYPDDEIVKIDNRLWTYKEVRGLVELLTKHNVVV